MSDQPKLGNSHSSDYCEYFFIRSKENGYLITYDPTVSQNLFAGKMLAHNRGNQLFKFQAIPGNEQCAYIVHQATQLALTYDYHGFIQLQPINPDPNPNSQWLISATNQLRAAPDPTSGVVSILGPSGADFQIGLQVPSPDDTLQQWELFYPSDFVYVRHSWTGRVLTTDENHNATWLPLNPQISDYQQWGITSDGYLVSRATAEVLQLSDPSPSAGLIVNTATQASAKQGNLYQRLDVISNGDGTFRTYGGFTLAKGPNNTVVTATYSPTDFTQLIEPLSPFQFFNIANGLSSNQPPLWLSRSGNTTTLVSDPTGDEQLFTISRYGEIISPVDGYVLQVQGIGATPGFVDPEPEAIGYDTTTFQTAPAAQGMNGYMEIAMRSSPAIGLLVYAGRPMAPWMFYIQPPVSGNQAWRLVGASGTLFSQYQDIARAYFENPAPLPNQTNQLRADDAEVLSLNDVPKSVSVIIALVTGILDIAAGISVGTVTDAVAVRVAQVVLGSEEVAAKVAVIMQGTVTAASVIAVADGITKAGLWLQILKLLLPNSFWGWAITIAKLGVTIAAWAVPGLGAAVTGAKIALLCADIIRILAENSIAAAAEAEIIQAHARRLANSPIRKGGQSALVSRLSLSNEAAELISPKVRFVIAEP